MSESFFSGVLSPDFSLVKAGERRSLTPVSGASRAAALAALFEKARETHRPMTVICADASEAARLSDELSWLKPEARIGMLPDWETLPYDTMSPHETLVSERLETLWKLTNNEKGQFLDILFASACCAAFRLSPRSYVLSNTFFYKVGQKVNLESLKHTLVQSGYSRVDQVYGAGEFSVRGSIVDIFPMGEVTPFRLDLFDDEIESIRMFDPDSQRSGNPTDAIRILPGHEFPMDEASLNTFRTNWRKTFEGDPTRSVVYNDTFKSIASAGIEYYLPLFFEATETLADYLPPESLIVTVGDVEQAVSAFLKETEERYTFLQHDAERPALAPKALLLTAPDLFTSFAPFGRLRLLAAPSELPDVALERKAQKPLAKLENYLTVCAMQNRRVLLLASGQGRLMRLEDLLQNDFRQAERVESIAEFFHSTAPVCLAQAPISSGFTVNNPKVAFVTEGEIYQLKATGRMRRRRSAADTLEATIRDIGELAPGDPVVHAEHGVGRYVGLETIETGEGKNEYLRIDYDKGAKLFVPVSQLHLIGRYTGADPDHAPINSLGRGEWEKVKKKAAQKAHDTAAELLNLYAVRESRTGCRYEIKRADYEAFCEGFAYEETPDQTQAINSVLDDMQSARPMDRLICGDVGFGKTEVALRAAFVAAMNGKQVAVLCPTTLLAEQHARSFTDRFAAWPVTVRELSRFRTTKQVTQALEGIADGTVDIVIGTHKLLGEKVRFKRLGLIIVDEEHRFGVRQKERLKALRAEADILTLTATPIPRTLAMSLDGIRDYSIIATAPEKRLAIKTFVRRETDDLIRQAVLRELKRGGQVYFLHNEVETIENRFTRLKALLPEARIGLAHGQMPERDLQVAMRAFYEQRYNVLLCSTIIENGIDIPNANTIIMHRADKLGLAQLHQLRGRVGRSHHQAYAYLLIPGEDAITKNARKRLDAIERLDNLGSGFYLSMYDLEIRGAGEILGEEQSGEISKVGFELYTQMLKDAVDALKSGKTPALDHPFGSLSEINLHLSALLPDDYVPDVSSRLTFYKRLALARDITEIESVIDDLTDRFGKLPEQALNLIAVHRMRIHCKTLGIRKIDAAESAIVFTFDDKPHFNPLALVRLLQSRRDMRMTAPEKLKFTVATHGRDDRVRAIRLLINPLLASKTESSGLYNTVP